MRNEQAFDVLVIGAGPAGAVSACRLLQLGFRVCIVEKAIFPRLQIGESLSPGVQNIFKFLNAEDLLEESTRFRHLPTTLLWNLQSSESFRHSHGNIVVDRSVIDLKMLAHCGTLGAACYCPAEIVDLEFSDEKWRATIRSENNIIHASATIVLDAKGRSGTRHAERFLTGPTSVAMWCHAPFQILGPMTNVEALNDSWIWGSPVSNDHYRIMVFVDPALIDVKNRGLVFQNEIAKSLLFKQALPFIPKSPLKSFLVLNYVHNNPWEQNYVRLGESAFTLDPLSSTGVEKAMRFSLKTAVAVNSMLRTSNESISRRYYFKEIIDSALSHQHTANKFYQSVWCYEQSDFWKKRIWNTLSSDLPGSFNREVVGQPVPNLNELALRQDEYNERSMYSMLDQQITKSLDIEYVSVIGIQNDQLIESVALRHPNLPSDVIYFGDVNVINLLDLISHSEIMSDLIEKWERQIPKETSIKILVQLINRRVLGFKN